MRTVEIHDGLDKKEIRDLIGKELHELSTITSNPERIEQKIAELQAELKKCRRKQAFLEMMNHFGWKEMDISEEISDYSWDTHIEFIGTEEDFDAVVERSHANKSLHATQKDGQET